MNTSVSILFYIKKAKANNLGFYPIYTRVKVNAKRFEFSTNKYINPDKWSSECNKVKGSSEEARKINSHLDSLIAKNSRNEKKLIAGDKDITVEVFNDVLTGKTKKHHKRLIP